MTRTRIAAVMSAMVLALPQVGSAQGPITIAAGATTSLTVAPGARLTIAVLVDMSAAAGGNLAAVSSGVSWNAALLRLDSLTQAGFGSLTANTTNAANGAATFAVFSSSGTTASTTVANLYFTATTTSGGTRVLLAPTAGGNEQGADVTALLRGRGADVCVVTAGKWGDANGDGQINIIDAQQIARFSVGLSVANASGVAASGDVNADNVVNIIDAQQVARFSVGLSAAARVNTDQFTAPVASSIAVTPATNAIVLGASVQLTPTPRDVNGNTISGCAAVTWQSSNPAIAVVNVSGYVTAVANGTTTIVATSGSRTASATITAGTGSPDPTALSLTTPPSPTAASGVAFAQQPVVQLRDANGAAMARAGVVITASLGAGGRTLGGTPTATTASNGAASFTNLSITGANGSQDVIFSSPGLTPVAATVAIGQSSTATILTLTTAPSPNAHSGVPFPVQPVVQLRDASNNPVAQGGVAVGVSLTAGGGTLSGTTGVVTAADGSATFSGLTLTGTPGVRQLSFSSPGAANVTAAVSLSDAPPPPLDATFVLVAGDNQTAAVRAAVPIRPSVRIVDSNGNPVPGIPVTFTAQGGGTTTGNQPSTDANGYATVGSWTVGSTPGTNTLGAAAAGVSNWITFTATVILNPAPVSAMAAGDAGCALATNGDAYCWNSANSGLATKVLGVISFTELSTKSTRVCGVATNGDAYCWTNTSSQSTFTPVLVGGGLSFRSISTGFDHTCAVTTSGAAYCWGQNGGGWLGNGTTQNSTLPTAVSGGLTFDRVSVGWQFSCGLAVGGAAYCWGFDGAGQMGNGAQGPAPFPVQVAGGLTFTNISAGQYHACAVTSTGAAYCWGAINGDINTTTQPAQHTPLAVVGGLSFSIINGGPKRTCGLTTTGEAYCWQTRPSPTPTPVPGGLTFTNVSDYSGVTSSGTAYTWPMGTTGVPGTPVKKMGP